MTSGPTFLGELRDRLLDQVLGLLNGKCTEVRRARRANTEKIFFRMEPH